MPDVDVRLLIVGDGSLRDECELILKNVTPEKVQFSGNQKLIAPFMRNMDVFVLPSQAEGISNTILEAMACGCAIIATDVGGNPELVDKNVNGFLVKAEKKSLVEKMKRYVDEPRLIEQHGRASLTRIKNHYALGNMVASYHNLYQQA